MNNKVSLGVSGAGGGCTGCVGPNIPWTSGRLEEGGGFCPPPPPRLRGAKMFKGCRVKDCTWAPPMDNAMEFRALHSPLEMI